MREMSVANKVGKQTCHSVCVCVCVNLCVCSNFSAQSDGNLKVHNRVLSSCLLEKACVFLCMRSCVRVCTVPPVSQSVRVPPVGGCVRVCVCHSTVRIPAVPLCALNYSSAQIYRQGIDAPITSLLKPWEGLNAHSEDGCRRPVVLTCPAGPPF